jgi:lipooligosaccharide transport system permease protein
MSGATLVSRLTPVLPFAGGMAWRLVRRNVIVGRKAWLLIMTGFFEPVFYLVGLGIGVGRLVGSIEVAGQAVPYAEFVAPALLAASAMNGAIYESTNNVHAKLFFKTYDGTLATPLRVRDIAVGELIYALMRGALYALGFVVVMLALGLARSWWVLAAVPGALLVGAAFGAVGLVVVTFIRTWADFGYVEVVMLPLFLFSATFVPLDQYPTAAQWLVPLTPLYHGVELLRALTLGAVDAGILWHVAHLVAMAAVGLAVADRRLEKRLLK